VSCVRSNKHGLRDSVINSVKNSEDLTLQQRNLMMTMAQIASSKQASVCNATFDIVRGATCTFTHYMNV